MLSRGEPVCSPRSIPKKCLDVVGAFSGQKWSICVTMDNELKDSLKYY